MPTNSKPTVLVVDDSSDDLLLIKMAVKHVRLNIDLRTVNGGEEALAYVSGEGCYKDRERYPMPALVLLDLKMPRVNGFDVLAKLKTMDLTPKPMVVVMSASRLPEDIEKARRLGAAAFHTKPAAFEDLRTMLETVLSFFFPSPTNDLPNAAAA